MPEIRTKSPLLFALVGGALMALAPLSLDMYLTAFNPMAGDLKAAPALIQLTLALFFAGVTLGQLLYGPLADRLGRKPPLVMGLTLFVLASVGCALTTDPWVLVVLRFLQACGASAGMVIAQALVHDVFERNQAGRVFSGLMLVMGIAPVVAPLLGNLFLAWGSWRLIFFFLAGFGLLTLGAVAFFLPETKGPNPQIKLSRAFAVYGSLFKKRHYISLVFSRSLVYAGMFTYITASPFIFMNLLGISGTSYAFLFGANALALMAGSQVNGFLLRRHAMEKLLHFSLVAIFFSGLLVLVSGLLPLNLWVLFIPLFLTMFFLGAIVPNATALGLVGHHEHTGSASALMGSLMFGLGFGASSLVSLFTMTNAVVMTGGIALCMALGFAIYLGGKGKGPGRGEPL